MNTNFANFSIHYVFAKVHIYIIYGLHDNGLVFAMEKINLQEKIARICSATFKGFYYKIGLYFTNIF